MDDRSFSRETELTQAKENRRKAAELLALSANIQNLLNDAYDALKSAGAWGIWDLLGGGFLSTLIKHGKIDTATECMQRARPLLERLNRELQGIDAPVELRGGIGEFASFADFFFDGLFADLYVQRQIRSMQSNIPPVLEHLQKVDRTLQKLDQHEAEHIRSLGGL